MDKKEKTEKLLVVIGVLKETAVRFRALGKLAKNEFNSGYPSFCRQRLEERARLLVDLPGRLLDDVMEVDSVIGHRIVLEILWFAGCAKKAIKDSKIDFLFTVLKTLPDDDERDMNSLESLISFLEEKLQQFV